jgi:hypothetical protein
MPTRADLPSPFSSGRTATNSAKSPKVFYLVLGMSHESNTSANQFSPSSLIPGADFLSHFFLGRTVTNLAKATKVFYPGPGTLHGSKTIAKQLSLSLLIPADGTIMSVKTTTAVKTTTTFSLRHINPAATWKQTYLKTRNRTLPNRPILPGQKVTLRVLRRRRLPRQRGLPQSRLPRRQKRLSMK